MSRAPEIEPDWELVRKRNFVERLKHEKPGLDVLRDLPAMIEAGYEAVREEDMVRLQWYGLYHDKPKLGYFMLRVKTPGGVLTPAKLRTIGRVSQEYGRGHGELTTRQNIQLHWLAMERLPEVLSLLGEAGLSTTGACGDNVRNVTGCPVAGLDPDELFDCSPLLEETAAFFLSRPEYSDLPRKHKITISSCAHQCNAPEIHCIALIGTLLDGRPGFGVRVGGGLASWPRLASDLGVFVPYEEAIPVLQAIVDVWREDRRYRLSRARARLKFMVDDLGVPAFRERVEARLGRPLADGAAPLAPGGSTTTRGSIRRRGRGSTTPASRSTSGSARASRCWGWPISRRATAARSGSPGGRTSSSPTSRSARLPEVLAAAARLGFPLDPASAGGLKALSIACTGDPFCNFTVAETKGRLATIVAHLETTFGERAADLRLNLDGCPHACAHHWTGDIGLQGTTLRERGPKGERLQGYDLFLRGGLGREAAIGRPVLRRVPGEEVHVVIERLFRSYLEARQEGERIQQFFTRHADEELLAMAGMAGMSEMSGMSETAGSAGTTEVTPSN